MDSQKSKYLESGVDIAGAAIGGAIGVLGGPGGAIIGGAAGLLTSKCVNDLLARFLSSHEKRRILSSVDYSVSKINERISNGEKIREDGFFDEAGSRSKAEEIFEGVLIKSKSQYQEKKIKYISNIYSNSVFDEGVMAEDVHQILDTVERFTYRKICLIKFFFENARGEFPNIRDSDYRQEYEYGSNIELEILLQDIMDLYNIGLIGREDDTSLLDTSDVHPKIMRLTNIGKTYFKILGIQEIPRKDYQTVIDNLSV